MLLSCFSLFATSVAAQDNLPFSGKVLIQWFNSDGQLVEVNWKRTAQWVWKETKNKSRTLELKLLVQLPKQLHAKQPSKSSELKIQILEPNRKSSSADNGQTISILSTTSTFSTKLNFEPSAISPSAKNSGLFFTITSPTPQILVHSSCEKEGLQVSPILNEDSKSFFFGVSCNKEKKDVLIKFYIAESDILKNSNDNTIKTHQIKVPLEPVRSLGLFRVFSPGMTPYNEFEVSFKPGH